VYQGGSCLGYQVADGMVPHGAGGFFAEGVELVEPPSFASARRLPPPTFRTAVPLPSRPNEDDDFDEEGEAALEALEREERGLPELSAARGGGSSNWPADDETAVAELGVCIDCGDARGHAKFFEAFGVNACYDCQRAARGPGGKYQLMTKTKVKDEYLLTDRHLSRDHGGIGCMLQPNPHSATHSGCAHSDMKLYLREQVEELALKVWGTDEALFTERERRVDERQLKAEKRKRKAADREAAARAGTNLVPSSKRPAVTVKHSTEMSARVSHTHAFLPDETYDEASDTWTKRCACGFKVEYERI